MQVSQIKLKREGVATLQALFIFLFASLEHLIRSSFGIVTGLVLLAVVILGNNFGRAGVAYVAVVTPPIAFAVTALFWSFISYNIHLTKFAVDFIGALASMAPWLILGAIYGWYNFLNLRAKQRISDARNRV